MPAYWLARSRILDAAEYSRYTDQVPSILTAFGGRVLARGGQYRVLEGPEDFHRFVVVEFPDFESAQACYRSEAYQAAAAFRMPPVGYAEITIVEGVAPVP